MAWVVFTDLDGTLLDSNYSFEVALDTLSWLESRDIPVVFCSSKTRAEIEVIRRKLNNNHPFISENGGGVFIPLGYFNNIRGRIVNSYLVIELGVRYEKLREMIKKLERSVGCTITGFGDLDVEQIASLTGLGVEEAVLAKKREYDEPVIVEPSECVEKVIEEARAMGLYVVRGGRFLHINGNSDKGKAVETLKKLYRQKFGEIKTIGLGDAPNDIPLLKSVDYPIMVRNVDIPDLPNLIRTSSSGPHGFCEGIMKVLGGM